MSGGTLCYTASTSGQYECDWFYSSDPNADCKTIGGQSAAPGHCNPSGLVGCCVEAAGPYTLGTCWYTQAEAQAAKQNCPQMNNGTWETCVP